LSAGLPVIASHFPRWKEVVEGNDCGLTVDPTRPQEIARAMDELLSQPARRRQMGRNGLKAVQTRYNWQTQGRILLQLYKELLPDAPRTT
ncbi:MAG: glycosyltransferase family 1 protein, partial [Caldilineae bacterium]